MCPASQHNEWDELFTAFAEVGASLAAKIAAKLVSSLTTSPYCSLPPAGLQGYIPYPHIAAVCMFELAICGGPYLKNFDLVGVWKNESY